MCPAVRVHPEAFQADQAAAHQAEVVADQDHQAEVSVLQAMVQEHQNQSQLPPYHRGQEAIMSLDQYK